MSQLSNKIEDLIVVIFLPMFFTVSGLRTEIGLIDSGRLWGLTVLIIVLTCAAKVIGCMISFSLLLFIGVLSCCWLTNSSYVCVCLIIACRVCICMSYRVCPLKETDVAFC